MRSRRAALLPQSCGHPTSVSSHYFQIGFFRWRLTLFFWRRILHFDSPQCLGKETSTYVSIHSAFELQSIPLFVCVNSNRARYIRNLFSMMSRFFVDKRFIWQVCEGRSLAYGSIYQRFVWRPSDARSHKGSWVVVISLLLFNIQWGLSLSALDVLCNLKKQDSHFTLFLKYLNSFEIRSHKYRKHSWWQWTHSIIRYMFWVYGVRTYVQTLFFENLRPPFNDSWQFKFVTPNDSRDQRTYQHSNKSFRDVYFVTHHPWVVI